MGREELLQQVDSDFQNLLSTVDGLSEEQMSEVWFGAWSVRDILAHVAGWHREEAGMLERMARGERPVPEGADYPYNAADAWNARFVERWQTASPATILEEMKASKKAYVAAARQLPEGRFQEGRTAQRLLREGCIDHYREHAGEIREWRQREGI